MSALSTGPSDLEMLARRVARLVVTQAQASASIMAVPTGAGRDALAAEALEIAAQLARATKQLELAEAYSYYRSTGKWVGGPHPTTSSERTVLRRANGTGLSSVNAAESALDS